MLSEMAVGLRENLQETSILSGKNHGFRLRFSPTNQSNDSEMAVECESFTCKILLHQDLET